MNLNKPQWRWGRKRMHTKDTEDKREKLPMEKKFDQWVYGGISYFAQAVAGSVATYWVKHAGGKPIFDRWAKNLGPALVSKLTSYKGEKAVEVANGWLTVVALVSVGNLFVAPVKWMEDIKISTVEKWTKQDNEKRAARGEAISPEELAQQERLLDDLKAAPKQTWWSLGMGRMASLVPVFAGLHIFSGANKAMESGFQKLTSNVAKGVGMKKLGNSEVFHNASGIAFMDGFYSMLSAGGMYVYSHFIAPPQKAAKDEPILKELMAPDTILEETPAPKKKFAPQRYDTHEKSFTASLAAEAHNNQMAI